MARFYPSRHALALLICPEMGVEARLKARRAVVDEDQVKAAWRGWLTAEGTAAESPSGDDVKQRILSIRSVQNVSQLQMATALGFAPSYISAIECGRREPSREFLKKMRSVYGVSADWLLFGDAAK